MKKNVKLVIFLVLLLLIGGSCFAGVNSFSLSLQAYYQNTVEEISVEEAKEKITSRFSVYDIEDINYVNTTEGKFKTHNFLLTFKDQDEICVQVTTQGGYILTIGCYAQDNKEFLEKQQCEKMVEDFVQNLGFTDLQVVWSTEVGNQMIVNLAPIVNDVIVYPDLLKATVICETGDIKELEARSYLFENEAEKRNMDLLVPDITSKEAEEIIKERYDDKFVIENSRLAVISKEDEEVLTYEVKAKIKEVIYYIYINAENGDTEQVLTAFN